MKVTCSITTTTTTTKAFWLFPCMVLATCCSLVTACNHKEEKKWCKKLHENPDEDHHQVFDYIVVGAGAGGGVVASRLAEAGFKTLLLDAGPDYESIITQVPLFWPLSTIQPEIEWAFRTKNTEMASGRDDVLYPRASMIGGCTTHNAMQAFYSYPDTWSNLANLTGDPNFEESHMRSLFEKLEKNEYGSPFPGHGTDGYISTSLPDTRLLTEPQFYDPQLLTVLGVFNQTYPCSEPDSLHCLTDPLNLIADRNAVEAEQLEGINLPPHTISPEQGYTRSSVYNLIKQVEKDTSNLVVKPNSFVTNVLIKKQGDGKEPIAYGVKVTKGEGLYEASTLSTTTTTGTPSPLGAETTSTSATISTNTETYATSAANTGKKGASSSGGKKSVSSSSSGKKGANRELSENADASREKLYFARREVIVSGGTFNTPQILMLSGVGPKDELEQHDIDLVAEVPGVGKNLKDKIETTVNLDMAEDWKLFEQGCTFLQPEATLDQCFLDYLSGNFPNLYTSTGINLGFQVKSPNASYPDLYGQVGPLYFVEYKDDWVHELFDATKTNALTFNLNNAMKSTVGEVTLKSDNPFDMAEIDFKGYTDEDIEDSLYFVKQVLGIAEFLKEIGLATAITAPGPEVDLSNDDELKEYILGRAWGHHACCTAKIGTDDDDMAVLDSRFRVRGVNHLRVVDNSAFPNDSAFFPLLSIYMLAEKAVEDILEDSASSVITKDAFGCS